MPGEIKSVTGIAQKHVAAITEAVSGFESTGTPSQGNQRNSPTDTMRAAFESMKALCKELESGLSGDVGNITAMSKEFEVWDQRSAAGTEYGIK